jgi:hypothetical protein
MEATKPYEFIGFGAMEATKPYEFIRFGAMETPGLGPDSVPAPGARKLRGPIRKLRAPDLRGAY